MSILDSLKSMFGSALKKEARNALKGAADGIRKMGSNRSESFTFAAIPQNADELKALPEASLDSPFKTAALTVLAMCRYEEDPEAVKEMLNFLKGPDPVTTPELNFIKERLTNKYYKPFSYFDGATPENSYKPSTPYRISIYENPYSFDNDGWATLWVKSGGADNMRQIKLRKKPSTGQWFMNEIQFLGDIRIPTADDKWA